MKCENISKLLIPYLDRRANSAERAEVEDHLAGCSVCRARADEFHKLLGVLDEMPALEPSFAFDARLRQRIAARPRPHWIGWLMPHPRLAFSMAMLLVLSVWMARIPPASVHPGESVADFEAVKDLDVLENYDVLSKFDALSELPSMTLPQASKPQQNQ